MSTYTQVAYTWIWPTLTNALAYFIIDKAGIVDYIHDKAEGDMLGAIATGASYTTAQEGLRLFNGQPMFWMNGGYIRFADDIAYNALISLIVAQFKLDKPIEGLVMSVPGLDYDMAMSLANGLLMTAGQLIRQIIDTNIDYQLFTTVTHPVLTLARSANMAS